MKNWHLASRQAQNAYSEPQGQKRNTKEPYQAEIYDEKTKLTKEPYHPFCSILIRLLLGVIALADA